VTPHQDLERRAGLGFRQRRGLRGGRESGYTPGWLFDKNKTTEKRKQIALKVKRMGAAYLYEAVGLGPADHGDLAKIEEALAQPN